MAVFSEVAQALRALRDLLTQSINRGDESIKRAFVPRQKMIDETLGLARPDTREAGEDLCQPVD